MKSRNKKKLMWLPFFIGMFFGNPFIRETISFFGEEVEKGDSLDLLLCILYHLGTIILISFLIFFITV